MANTVSGLYQTVVAAATEASQALVYNLEAVDSCYMDYRPEPATIGQTLNVVIPAIRTAGVVDAGVGDISLVDVSETTVAIVFNKHPFDGLVIRDFEQFNSPQLLRRLFFDSAIKGIKENINAAVTALFTTGNFTTNSAISTTAGIITTAQFLGGMAVLSDQRVPVRNDPENMSLLLPSVPYTKVLGDSNWTQAQIAGMKTAEFVRDRGIMPTAYGMTAKLDQQMPISGSVGSRTFTGAYMHRYSVAIVTRPLPPPDQKVVDFMYLDFSGIPIRVTLGYNQFPKQGYILTVDAGYGLKVVRENMTQLFTIAE
jgi:hypothetical protein